MFTRDDFLERLKQNKAMLTKKVEVVDLLIARLENVELVEDEEFLVPAMDCDSLISFSAWLCTRERVIH